MHNPSIHSNQENVTIKDNKENLYRQVQLVVNSLVREVIIKILWFLIEHTVLKDCKNSGKLFSIIQHMIYNNVFDEIEEEQTYMKKIIYEAIKKHLKFADQRIHDSLCDRIRLRIIDDKEIRVIQELIATECDISFMQELTNQMDGFIQNTVQQLVHTIGQEQFDRDQIEDIKEQFAKSIIKCMSTDFRDQYLALFVGILIEKRVVRIANIINSHINSFFQEQYLQSVKKFQTDLHVGLSESIIEERDPPEVNHFQATGFMEFYSISLSDKSKYELEIKLAQMINREFQQTNQQVSIYNVKPMTITKSSRYLEILKKFIAKEKSLSNSKGNGKQILLTRNPKIIKRLIMEFRQARL